MNSLEFWFYLTLFAAIAAICFRLATGIDRWVRFPLGLYLAIYGLTTLVGGLWMSATDGGALSDLQWGVDISVLTNFGGLRYWSLLFAPFIVPAVTIVLLKPFHCESLLAAPLQSIPQRISPIALLGVSTFFFGYCFMRLAMAGCLFNFLQWLNTGGDYLGMIATRQSTESLGSVFFGITYIALPTLSFAALYQYRLYRNWSWLGVLLALVSGTIFINMELMQKAPMLLFLMFLGIGLMELRLLAYRNMLWMLVGLVACVTFLQSLVLNDWSTAQSMQLLIFRMAHSFPYYVNLYPDVMPYAGIESGFHLVGMGSPATDCWDVFNFMYPQVTWAQGAAPAAAHVRAYSQAGMPFALVNLAIIGIVIKATGGLRSRITGPISFAFYLQLLILLYFVTQTSLREAVISCYGIFWAVIALLPLVFLQPAHRHPVSTTTGTVQLFRPNRPKVARQPNAPHRMVG